MPLDRGRRARPGQYPHQGWPTPISTPAGPSRAVALGRT